MGGLKSFASSDKVITRFKTDVSDDSDLSNKCFVNYNYDYCQIAACDESCL